MYNRERHSWKKDLKICKMAKFGSGIFKIANIWFQKVEKFYRQTSVKFTNFNDPPLGPKIK